MLRNVVVKVNINTQNNYLLKKEKLCTVSLKYKSLCNPCSLGTLRLSRHLHRGLSLGPQSWGIC